MSNNQNLRVQEELSKLKSQGLATSHRTKFNESGMYFLDVFIVLLYICKHLYLVSLSFNVISVL
jgi:hypothetical protein